VSKLCARVCVQLCVSNLLCLCLFMSNCLCSFSYSNLVLNHLCQSVFLFMCQIVCDQIFESKRMYDIIHIIEFGFGEMKKKEKIV